MKSLIRGAFALLTSVILIPSLWAQDPYGELDLDKTAPVFNGEVDTMKYSKYLLDNPVSYYRLYVSWNKGTDSQYHRMVMKLDTKFRVFELEYDDVVVPIDPSQPLPKIPYPKEGIMMNFHAHLAAFGEDGPWDHIASGSLYEPVMDPHQTMVFDWRADMERVSIPYELPDGANPNDLILVVDRLDGYQYAEPWIEWSESFETYLDPTMAGGFPYAVYNRRTGLLLDQGVITMDGLDSPEGGVIQIDYGEGVVMVPPFGRQEYFDSILDGHVERGRWLYPSKSFIFDCPQGRQVEVTVEDLSGNIELYEYFGGEMILIDSRVDVGYDEVVINIPGESRERKFVLFLVGTGEKDVQKVDVEINFDAGRG